MIVSRQNDKLALDVENGTNVRPGPGTRVFMFNKQGTDNQWFRDDTTTGTIRSKVNEELCLDADGQCVNRLFTVLPANYLPKRYLIQFDIMTGTYR